MGDKGVNPSFPLSCTEGIGPGLCSRGIGIEPRYIPGGLCHARRGACEGGVCGPGAIWRNPGEEALSSSAKVQVKNPKPTPCCCLVFLFCQGGGGGWGGHRYDSTVVFVLLRRFLLARELSAVDCLHGCALCVFFLSSLQHVGVEAEAVRLFNSTNGAFGIYCSRERRRKCHDAWHDAVARRVTEGRRGGVTLG